VLTSLKKIIQEVSKIPDLDTALARLVTMVKQTMEVDSCSIYLSNQEQSAVVLRATDGLDRAAIGVVSIGLNEGLIGLVGDREEPLNIENAPQHPRFKHYPEVKEDSYHAFLGAPIMHQRKVLGVITMQQSDARRFSEDDEAFLVTLAAQIALEIVNAKMRSGITFPNENSHKQPRSLNGIPGSPGLALGTGFVANFKHELSQLLPRKSADTDSQISQYRKAVDITRALCNSL